VDASWLTSESARRALRLETCELMSEDISPT
jgi:hypothetical protein